MEFQRKFIYSTRGIVMKEQILNYEKDFFKQSFCGDIRNLEKRLSKDFYEYGKSGLVYDRAIVINHLNNLPNDRQIEILKFEMTQLSECVLLVNYISHHEDDNSYALRTSIWKNEEGTWKLFFHQGTPQHN